MKKALNAIKTARESKSYDLQPAGVTFGWNIQLKGGFRMVQGFIKVPAPKGKPLTIDVGYIPILVVNTDYIDVVGVPKLAGIASIPTQEIAHFYNAENPLWVDRIIKGNMTTCMVVSRKFLMADNKLKALILQRLALSQSYETLDDPEFMSMNGSRINGAAVLATNKKLITLYGRAAKHFLRKEARNEAAFIGGLVKASEFPNADYSASIVETPIEDANVQPPEETPSTSAQKKSAKTKTGLNTKAVNSVEGNVPATTPVAEA